MKLVILAILIISSTIISPAYAGDEFSQSQQTEPGVSCNLKLVKSSYHMGEPIDATLQIAVENGKHISYSSMPLVRNDYVIVCDRSNDIALKRKLVANRWKSYAVLSRAPDEIKGQLNTKITLNDFYCFNASGHYKLYIVSNNLFNKAGGSSVALSVSSNIVDLDILPDDTTWDQFQLSHIQELIQSDDPDKQSEGIRLLKYLQTHDAIDEAISLIGKKTVLVSGLSEYLCNTYDAKYTESAIREKIRDSDYPIPFDIVEVFAFLTQPANNTNSSANNNYQKQIPTITLPYREADNEIKLYNKLSPKLLVTNTYRLLQSAVKLKHGYAKAATLYTLLIINKDYYPAMKSVDIKLYASELQPLLTKLELEEQAHVLSNDKWFRSMDGKTMLSYLDWASRLHGTINGESDKYTLREVAIHRLNQLYPREARKLILNDIQSASPEMGFDTLTMLPDKELPRIDKIILKHLCENNGSELVLS